MSSNFPHIPAPKRRTVIVAVVVGAVVLVAILAAVAALHSRSNAAFGSALSPSNISRVTLHTKSGDVKLSPFAIADALKKVVSVANRDAAAKRQAGNDAPAHAEVHWVLSSDAGYIDVGDVLPAATASKSLPYVPSSVWAQCETKPLTHSVCAAFLARHFPDTPFREYVSGACEMWSLDTSSAQGAASVLRLNQPMRGIDSHPAPVSMLLLNADRLVATASTPNGTRVTAEVRFVRNNASLLVLQPDGNLVVYDDACKPLWASNTVQPRKGVFVAYLTGTQILIYNKVTKDQVAAVALPPKA